MVNMDMLKQIIKDSGLKKSYIAEQCGMTPTWFSQITQADEPYDFKVSQVERLRDVLRLTEEEVLSIFFLKGGE